MLLLERVKVETPSLLDWRKEALRAVLEGTDAEEELGRLVMWAKYSQVPLCNLGQGTQLLDNVTNLQLGRLLHAEDRSAGGASTVRSWPPVTSRGRSLGRC